MAMCDACGTTEHELYGSQVAVQANRHGKWNERAAPNCAYKSVIDKMTVMVNRSTDDLRWFKLPER